MHAHAGCVGGGGGFLDFERGVLTLKKKRREKWRWAPGVGGGGGGGVILNSER